MLETRSLSGLTYPSLGRVTGTDVAREEAFQQQRLLRPEASRMALGVNSDVTCSPILTSPKANGRVVFVNIDSGYRAALPTQVLMPSIVCKKVWTFIQLPLLSMG